MIMVWSPFAMKHLTKQGLTALMIAALAASMGGFTGQSSAWAKNNTFLTLQQRRIELRGINLMPDGKGLMLDSNRPLRDRDSRSLTVLRFPQPNRLLVDIPNARLSNAPLVLSVRRNGIDRIEMTEVASDFYNAVRLVIYVNDADTLGRLMPTLNGNFLKLEESAVASRPQNNIKLATDINRYGESFSSAKTTVRYGKRVPIMPLPPSVSPLPAIKPIKNAIPVFVQEKARLPENGNPSHQAQTIMGTPLQAGTSVIESVELQGRRLLIQAHAGAPIRIKNRIVLKEPNRLVLDLDNAVLASRALIGTVSGDSDRMRRVRVGQFDESTVRLVIETPTPASFQPIFNRQENVNTLALVPSESTAIMPEGIPGEIESIDLKRENGATILRLAASTPIQHRMVKKGDKVILELLNEAAHPTPIPFDNRQYPELDRMKIEKGDSDAANSKLLVILANRDMKVTPTLSDGGKVLELSVIPTDDPAASSNTVISNQTTGSGGMSNAPLPLPIDNIPVFAPAGQAPFPARIVVDAGHGGKDNGANRNGINEKDLNLSLALMLRDALTAKGFKVYMTRSTDVFLPLPQITAITNQVHPDLFISIHHNASVNTAQHGIETYYFTPQSIALARKVHTREINGVGERDGGVKQARFYVIHHTDVPAILCEVGYVSNPAELTSLQGMDRKMKTARSIADGVVDYLQTRISAKAR
jgi:N-acetylmuramoyl-L-alanine amidase